MRVDDGDVVANRALGLELPHALEHRRRREADSLGDVGLGCARVRLKNRPGSARPFRRSFCLDADIHE